MLYRALEYMLHEEVDGMSEGIKLLDVLGALHAPSTFPRRLDGDFIWQGEEYTYSAYVVVPTVSDAYVRIDIRRKK